MALSQNIDFSKLTPIEFMFGEDFEQTQELVALFEEAELYVSSLRWCDHVKKAYFGLGVSDFIGIFLFEIEPPEDTMGRFHWVVTGDVPTACFSADDCPNSAFALHKYIGEMKNRFNSVCVGVAADCIHFLNEDAADQRPHDFMKKIAFLDTVILDLYKDELV